ncbi:hypothetical protein ISN45_Aa07g036040 [Arabidopsis thaliana x Arabidopsis arenosa]|uniref:Uncharacterized protein n=1 Tax=Arabidopsis thaliana x Arabidopsis arenosa TaxID=1240361 RepID=A0A8T1YCR3_9BRAS|nr:hypothetical protein ISN45_Aa07g036040 [Arabidopsis thaliana x Arabidopsis arenosa]
MANRGFQTYVFGFFTTMVLQGLTPTVPIQTSISLMAPSPSWDKFSSIDSDSCHPQLCFFFVISIRWNRDDVLPCRRLVSGESVLYRWNVRLSIGDCLLTRRYGIFVWVFDPGINKSITMVEGIRFTRDRIWNFIQTVMGLHVLNLSIVAKIGNVYLDCADGLLVKFVVSTWLSNSYEYKRAHAQDGKCRVCLQILPEAHIGTFVMITKCPDLQTRTIQLVSHRPFPTAYLDVNPDTNWSFGMDYFECKARKLMKHQSSDVILMGFHSAIYCLHWKQPLWQQPWGGRQRILQHRHRKPLLQPSSILISTRRKDPKSYLTTTRLNLLVNIMPRAFWSLSYKLLANKKCMKKGHNRFRLLACKTSERIARLYSTSSSKLF